MNYDKQLAKYARQLDNPKYFDRILRVIEKAEKEKYEFKDFNDYDLEKITREIEAYFEAITTEEDHKQMIKYCNSRWFILSDKNFILYETESLILALMFYVKTYLLLLYVKIIQTITPEKWEEAENATRELYLCRGAVKAAEIIGCEIFDLEEKIVEL